MRPIVPSETQESETPGPGDQRDEKSPETGIHKLNFWLKDPDLGSSSRGSPLIVGSLERLLL